jgi:hypothetical protein
MYSSARWVGSGGGWMTLANFCSMHFRGGAKRYFTTVRRADERRCTWRARP